MLLLWLPPEYRSNPTCRVRPGQILRRNGRYRPFSFLVRYICDRLRSHGETAGKLSGWPRQPGVYAAWPPGGQFCRRQVLRNSSITFSVRGDRHSLKSVCVLMWAELHELMDENKHLHGIEFKETVFTFLKKYDISSIQGRRGLTTKNYQARWRDKFQGSKKKA